ncbi:hypothetical protein [Saccharothrix sp. Mg75]|uniref:hypothetical protein n=1 Tax=Saccharothrix sp. Mg75 TaxID=3445357 RepID=UPI003EEC01E1
MTATESPAEALPVTGPLRLLPAALVGFLLAVAVLLAPVAPGRAEGVYRVDTPEFSVTGGDFDCVPSGERVACTVTLADRPFTVLLTAGAHNFEQCAASYDGRDLTCAPEMQYGLGAPWVRVSSTGLPREAAPFFPVWRDWLDRYHDRVYVFAVPSLAVLSALLACLLYRGPRRAPADRGRRALLLGGVCWLFPPLTGLVLVPWDRLGTAFLGMVSPVLAVFAVTAGVWQYLAAGPHGGRWWGRLGQTAVALVAGLVCSAGGLLWITVAAGLPD